MRISKIKYKNGVIGELSYFDYADADTSEVLFKSQEGPHPDWDGKWLAVQAFIPELLCAVGVEYFAKATLTGITYKIQSNDVAGVLLICELRIKDRVFNFNTPFTPETSGDDCNWSEEFTAALKAMLDEAKAYIKGDKRAQGMLFSKQDNTTVKVIMPPKAAPVAETEEVMIPELKEVYDLAAKRGASEKTVQLLDKVKALPLGQQLPALMALKSIVDVLRGG